jgi:hypothetical protein
MCLFDRDRPAPGCTQSGLQRSEAAEFLWRLPEATTMNEATPDTNPGIRAKPLRPSPTVAISCIGTALSGCLTQSHPNRVSKHTALKRGVLTKLFRSLARNAARDNRISQAIDSTWNPPCHAHRPTGKRFSQQQSLAQEDRVKPGWLRSANRNADPRRTNTLTLLGYPAKSIWASRLRDPFFPEKPFLFSYSFQMPSIVCRSSDWGWRAFGE